MTRCPYCDIEVSERAIEAEDGCCPECGAMLSTRSQFLEDDDDYEEDEFDDTYDDLNDDDDYIDEDRIREDALYDDEEFDDEEFHEFDEDDDDKY